MAFERKFKEGDKVKVKKIYHQEYNKVGEIICYVSNYGYIIKYGNFRRIYSVDALEKVDSNTPVDTILNVVHPEDLKPGCKVKLKEIIGTNNKQKLNLSNTIQIISKIKNGDIILENYPNISFAYYNFDKIIEEPEDDPSSLHIGDQVINRELNHSKFGKTGYIISYYNGNDYCSVRFQNHTWSIKLEYLEKVKPSEELSKNDSKNIKITSPENTSFTDFKVRDKVKIIAQPSVNFGKIGEITGINCSFYEVRIGINYYLYDQESLEKIMPSEENTKSFTISDLKPGIHVKIVDNLDGFIKNGKFLEGCKQCEGTIQTIEYIKKYSIKLYNISPLFSINEISEIIEEPKQSESLTFPLKEEQIITLLDGKNYIVRENKDRNKGSCSFCSLNGVKSHTRTCNNCLIQGKTNCTKVINKNFYFELIEDNKETESVKNPDQLSSDLIVDFIFTKYKFSLIDFKSESIGNFKSHKIL